MKKRRTLAIKSIIPLLILCLVSAFFYVPMNVDASDIHTATFLNGNFRRCDSDGNILESPAISLNSSDGIQFSPRNKLYVDLNYTVSIPANSIADFDFAMHFDAFSMDTYKKVSYSIIEPVLSVGDVIVSGQCSKTGEWGGYSIYSFRFVDVNVSDASTSCKLTFKVDASSLPNAVYKFNISPGGTSTLKSEYSYVASKPPLADNQISFDDFSSFEVTNYEDGIRKSSYQIYNLPWSNVASEGGSSTNGLTVLQCNFLSSDKPPDNSYCEYDMSLRFECTGARLIDYEILTDGYDNLNIRVLAEENGSYLITFTGYSDFTRSNMGFNVVFNFTNLGAPLAQGITFSGHLTFYPSSDKDTVSKGFNDVMNGFDSSSGNQSHSRFQNGVAEYESAEGSLFTSAKSGMDGYTFFDFSSIPAMLTGMSFVTSIMTSIFNSMGGSSGAGIVLSVLFSVMLVAMAIGLYRYFVSSGKTNKKGGD